MIGQQFSNSNLKTFFEYTRHFLRNEQNSETPIHEFEIFGILFCNFSFKLMWYTLIEKVLNQDGFTDTNHLQSKGFKFWDMSLWSAVSQTYHL